MNDSKENSHLEKAKMGRRKLRLGSLLVLGTMVFIALFSLYFVMTAKPEIRQFAISPFRYAVILLCTIPVVAIGIHLMVKGYRMETQGYLEDLKQTEKQLKEIVSDKNFEL